MGGKGCSPSPPVVDCTTPGSLGFRDGDRGISLNGFQIEGRQGLGGGSHFEAKAEGRRGMVQGREGLIVNGPVQPRLAGDKGAAIPGQGLVEALGPLGFSRGSG